MAEVGLVEVACATGEVGPVDRSGGGDREHGGGEAVGAGQPLRRDADELLEPLCQIVVLTPAATLRSPIATAPVVAAMTLLVWRTSPHGLKCTPTDRVRSG